MRSIHVLATMASIIVANGMDIESFLNKLTNLIQHPHKIQISETNVSKIIDESDQAGDNQQFEQYYTLTFLVDPDADEMINDDSFTDNVTITDFLEVKQCSDIEDVAANSVKVLYVVTENVAKCANILTRILNRKQGTVILAETSKAITFPGARTYVRDEEDLFNNSDDDLPYGHTFENLKLNKALGFQVYATSYYMTNRLAELIKASNYEKAINITATLYKQKSKTYCKIIMDRLITRMFKEKQYSIMNFAYKIKTDNDEIFQNCFPNAMKQIFDKHEVRIIHNQLKHPIRYFPENSDFLYNIDSNDSADNDAYWKIDPVWNNTTDSAVFKIKHTAMNIVFRNDHLSNSAIRLEPAGINEARELIFCICRLVNEECDTFTHSMKKTTFEKCGVNSSYYFESKD